MSFLWFKSSPESGMNMFRIDSVGNVILNEKLNYTKLSTFYRIKIKASVSMVLLYAAYIIRFLYIIYKLNYITTSLK